MARFLAELRRRHVFRVAAWYGAAGWLLIQFSTSAFPALGLPPWTTTFVVVLTLAGFPIALLLAWAFEITPDGGARRAPLAPDALPPSPAWRGWSPWLGLAAGVLLGVSGLQAWNAFRAGAASAAGPQDARASLAVLPFENLSSDPEQEYFSDGLAEQLLDALSAMPELRVIARTSSFSFKGQAVDVATIAGRLGVSHVLEGSVRKAGTRVRITAQLIRASDSSHLWSKTYDRELDDIFKVQDEIAAAVVGELRLTLGGGARPSAGAPRDAEAYALYLQGRYFADRRTKESLEKAVEHYRRAIARDPGYAAAWAALSFAYGDQSAYAGVPSEVGYPRAREAALKALALEPESARAHLALGRVQRQYDWDWAGAEASIRKARALDPSDVAILLEAGALASNLGRVEEYVAHYREAALRDPLSATAHHRLCVALQRSGRLAEATASCRKALEISPERNATRFLLCRIALTEGRPEQALAEIAAEPNSGWRLFGEALALHALGRGAEADAALRALVDGHATEKAYQIAEVYALLGDADQAFAWLDRAYAQRDAGLAAIKVSDAFGRLAGDPRYAALLARLKLPPG